MFWTLAISAPRTIDARACEYGLEQEGAETTPFTFHGENFLSKYYRFKTRKFQNTSFRPVEHDKPQESFTTTQTKAIDGYIQNIAEKQP